MSPLQIWESKMETWSIDTGKIYRFYPGQNAYLFEATLLAVRRTVNDYLRFQSKKCIGKITSKNLDSVMKEWEQAKCYSENCYAE